MHALEVSRGNPWLKPDFYPLRLFSDYLPRSGRKRQEVGTDTISVIF